VEAGNDFVIVGIGLNVNSTAFPDEIAGIATSLRLESGTDHSRDLLLGSIVRRFAASSRGIGGDFVHLLDPVRERCVLTGHRVSLMTAGGRREGVVEGIGHGGELLLRTARGLDVLLQADEVRIIDPI
jgi:BirA family biotin operon repressor/biotin-[acetyl-CoA-carboxylase] ligase